MRNTAAIRCVCVCVCVCVHVMRAASGAPAVFIACLGFIDCERRHVAVTVLCLTYFTNSCCRAGLMVNHVDISPKSARLSYTIHSARRSSVTISVFTARRVCNAHA